MVATPKGYTSPFPVYKYTKTRDVISDALKLADEIIKDLNDKELNKKYLEHPELSSIASLYNGLSVR